MQPLESLATLGAAGLPALPFATADSDLVDGGGASPYISFLHSRQKQYGAILQQCGQLPESTPVLREGDTYTPLQPFRLAILSDYKAQYWAQVDSTNAITRASLQQQRESPWKEHIDVLAVAFLPSRVALARITFRGPKAPAARDVLNSISEARDPEWRKRSKAHEQAFDSATQPWARVVGSVTQQMIQPRDTSKGQTPYYAASAACAPISSADFALLQAAYATPEFRETFQACYSDMAKRLEAVKAKCV